MAQPDPLGDTGGQYPERTLTGTRLDDGRVMMMVALERRDPDLEDGFDHRDTGGGGREVLSSPLGRIVMEFDEFERWVAKMVSWCRRERHRDAEKARAATLPATAAPPRPGARPAGRAKKRRR